MATSPPLRLISHRTGAPGLRLGLGPNLQPMQALQQLQQLFDRNSFWAQGRSRRELSRMLQTSAAVVSVWQGRQLVGFGRASSDGLFRAVLWDVVVASAHQGQGVGKRIVSSLLAHPRLIGVERVYLMTSNGTGFYRQLGFESVEQQTLMLRSKQT